MIFVFCLVLGFIVVVVVEGEFHELFAELRFFFVCPCKKFFVYYIYLGSVLIAVFCELAVFQFGCLLSWLDKLVG